MRKLIGTLFLTLWMVGCSDFGDLNNDPNNPAEPRTDLLMTDAQRTIGSYVGAVTGTLYSQYFSEVYYTDSSVYTTINFDFSGWYANTNNNGQTGPLTNLQTIIELNNNEDTANNSNVIAGGGTQNQLAVARILKAYFFHTITDRWGRVPYSEALKGQGNVTPKYDSMKSIYQGLLKELSEAVAQMNGEPGPTGDFIFGGDMGRWEAFANTLRMRIALRMADKNGQDAQQAFEDAYNDGIIQESVMFPYGSNNDNENPWYDRYETRIDYAISKTIADTMKNYEDMRLTVYAADSANSGPLQGDGSHGLDDIEGFPYGLSQSSAAEIGNTSRSLPGNQILQQDAELPILTMAEVHFALAEAKERGWNVPGTAQGHYEAGIEASWKQWGVYENQDFNNYLSKSDIAYDPGQWKQRIGFQKWIALFPLGYEAWAEWRRLDYPALDPAPDAVNDSGEIPVRQAYPTSESELNTENYKAAVKAQGSDGLDTKLWWDVN
ncbi:SusD/RagB family nutrient-binding outer membrane lipoprotein [Fodinibius saliphilus]|uniref:SusD/RagB family nutrient-binding outer membrane lipoprotein n=1 Tax=Fodinibius saliphilus TaxID=1920650 RepID=UPI0014864FCC|nr:SusD/RagB family nutrient-binding outer membrane lipoprotein [Fodinibius saliphilus]